MDAPRTGKDYRAKGNRKYYQCKVYPDNATVAGKKDMEEVVKEAQDRLGMYGKKTILFIDDSPFQQRPAGLPASIC